jgi:hypothetical protein
MRGGRVDQNQPHGDDRRTCYDGGTCDAEHQGELVRRRRLLSCWRLEYLRRTERCPLRTTGRDNAVMMRSVMSCLDHKGSRNS